MATMSLNVSDEYIGQWIMTRKPIDKQATADAKSEFQFQKHHFRFYFSFVNLYFHINCLFDFKSSRGKRKIICGKNNISELKINEKNMKIWWVKIMYVFHSPSLLAPALLASLHGLSPCATNEWMNFKRISTELYILCKWKSLFLSLSLLCYIFSPVCLLTMSWKHQWQNDGIENHRATRRHDNHKMNDIMSTTLRLSEHYFFFSSFCACAFATVELSERSKFHCEWKRNEIK